MTLTIGDLKTGDYLKMTSGDRYRIWHVESMGFHAYGRHRDCLDHLYLVDSNGEKRRFSFLPKDTKLFGAEIVNEFEQSEVDKLRRHIRAAISHFNYDEHQEGMAVLQNVLQEESE